MVRTSVKVDLLDTGALKHSDSEPPTLSNFLKLYFNYAYFFCLSPFRFARNGEASTFHVQTWGPQKVK